MRGEKNLGCGWMKCLFILPIFQSQEEKDRRILLHDWLREKEGLEREWVCGCDVTGVAG